MPHTTTGRQRARCHAFGLLHSMHAATATDSGAVRKAVRKAVRSAEQYLRLPARCPPSTAFCVSTLWAAGVVPLLHLVDSDDRLQRTSDWRAITAHNDLFHALLCRRSRFDAVSGCCHAAMVPVHAGISRRLLRTVTLPALCRAARLHATASPGETMSALSGAWRVFYRTAAWLQRAFPLVGCGRTRRCMRSHGVVPVACVLFAEAAPDPLQQFLQDGAVRVAARRIACLAQRGRGGAARDKQPASQHASRLRAFCWAVTRMQSLLSGDAEASPRSAADLAVGGQAATATFWHRAASMLPPIPADTAGLVLLRQLSARLRIMQVLTAGTVAAVSSASVSRGELRVLTQGNAPGSGALYTALQRECHRAFRAPAPRALLETIGPVWHACWIVGVPAPASTATKGKEEEEETKMRAAVQRAFAAMRSQVCLDLQRATAQRMCAALRRLRAAGRRDSSTSLGMRAVIAAFARNHATIKALDSGSAVTSAVARGLREAVAAVRAARLGARCMQFIDRVLQRRANARRRQTQKAKRDEGAAACPPMAQQLLADCLLAVPDANALVSQARHMCATRLLRQQWEGSHTRAVLRTCSPGTGPSRMTDDLEHRVTVHGRASFRFLRHNLWPLTPFECALPPALAEPVTSLSAAFRGMHPSRRLHWLWDVGTVVLAVTVPATVAAAVVRIQCAPVQAIVLGVLAGRSGGACLAAVSSSALAADVRCPQEYLRAVLRGLSRGPRPLVISGPTADTWALNRVWAPPASGRLSFPPSFTRFKVQRKPRNRRHQIDAWIVKALKRVGSVPQNAFVRRACEELSCNRRQVVSRVEALAAQGFVGRDGVCLRYC